MRRFLFGDGMSFIDRVLDRLGLQRRAQIAPQIAAYDLLGGGPGVTGITVTPDSALRSTAVMACVRVLSETLAALPLIVYRRQPRGKARATDFYLYGTLHDTPNPWMSSFTWRQVMTAHAALWGNAYCEIEVDNNGHVRNLWPLLPNQTEPFIMNDGSLAYRTYVPKSGMMVLPDYRVFHLKSVSMDGLRGISIIGQARRAVELSLATEEFGARFFGNGASPSVAIKYPGKLTDEGYKRMSESWTAAYSGLNNSHRAAILEEGTDIEKIGIPPEDSQFLETRKFQVREIARLFRVPPHLISDLEQATFSNIEQQSIEFVIYTMMPWFTNWEQEIDRSLLLESERQIYFAQFLIDGLLRGDIASRFAAYTAAINAGWMTRNEVRERENLNADNEELDKYLVPLNMGIIGTDAVVVENAPVGLGAGDGRT